MKLRNLKLHHYAATRAKLGLSQRQLAELLGISKAAVALAETGRRSLPTAALLRMGQLEIKIAAVMAAGNRTTKKENSINLAIPVFMEGSEELLNEQRYLTTKLKLMTERYNLLQGQLQLLDAIIEKEVDEPGNMFLLGLQVHRISILKRLTACDLIKQTSLQNKLNLLSAKEQMNIVNRQSSIVNTETLKDLHSPLNSVNHSRSPIHDSPITISVHDLERPYLRHVCRQAG